MKSAMLAVLISLGAAAAAAAGPRHGSAHFFRTSDYLDIDRWEEAWLNARMRFVDAENGWIVTDGPVFRSADGGASWTPLEGWTPLSADAVWFLDAGRGWLLDATGPLLTTTDGGRSWTRVSPPSGEWKKPGFRHPPDLFRFKDAQNGWGWDAPDLLRTRDGGRTWRKTSALPRGEEVTDICFGPGGEVYAAGLLTVGGGSSADGMFVRRVSTGSAPIVLRNPLRETVDAGFGAECFFKAGKLWATAPEGSAYSSKDAGGLWENLYLLSKGLLRVQDGGEQWVLGDALYFMAPYSIGGDRIGSISDDGAAALSFTTQGGRPKALFLNGRSLITYDLD
ncbi:MAG: hypothetical protein M0D55_15860 [Elusimicrobiota bacterium]|nr:MAG: hypothetical protein M0D55_15860 [Elusimicrobiota bacterium]